MENDEESEEPKTEDSSKRKEKEKNTLGEKEVIKKDDRKICEEKTDSSSDDSCTRNNFNGVGANKDDENSVNFTKNSDSLVTKSPDSKGDSFSKVKYKFKNRNYRTRKQAENLFSRDSSEDESEDQQIQRRKKKPKDGCLSGPDSGVQDSSSSVAAKKDETLNGEHDLNSVNREEEVVEKDDLISISFSSSSSSCSDSSTSPMEDGTFDVYDSDKEELPRALLKQKPKHKWFVTPEIVNRQIGCSNKKKGPELFQQRMYGSLYSVQRLELKYKLEYHSGCVNSLNFNPSGTLLASCSDDLYVCLWDWPLGKLVSSFLTKHKSSVFQAKFLPLTGDTHMVTCARDGQVRLITLTSSGEFHDTKKLAQHNGPAHNVATQNFNPHVFLSCGEDGKVVTYDVRQLKPAKIFRVRENTKAISLYSIHCNPLNNHEFVVCGEDNYIRIYDQRNLVKPRSRFCPQHLNGGENCLHITSAIFNYNGTEVVASYSNEDIYLFDTRHSDGCDFIHRYEGHRNTATVKGVNFFGPKSEFIISGSDCGNIFFWEKETEAIVQWMVGEEDGVVNCLEPHPDIPILATSGLYEDVKIWMPSCEQEPTLKGLKKTVTMNLKTRHADPDRSSRYMIDRQTPWHLWYRIRRFERLRRERLRTRDEGNDHGNISGDSLTFSDDEEGQGGHIHRLQCRPF